MKTAHTKKPPLRRRFLEYYLKTRAINFESETRVFVFCALPPQPVSERTPVARPPPPPPRAPKTSPHPPFLVRSEPNSRRPPQFQSHRRRAHVCPFTFLCPNTHTARSPRTHPSCPTLAPSGHVRRSSGVM
ncbi:hypothetical protein Zmor_027683 [Zophobas morio]|uniref:Uncharacterized protein n=1 Tax=Zophobas morio TaxID=2755281 RepID=A0AA38M2S6_9CUCU|nr:hypothetical protein Zmor_027683 [Zophobas morio]